MHDPITFIRLDGNGPFAPVDDDCAPFVAWRGHVEAGRIGANPPPAPATVARRIAMSEAFLGRRLRRHEGGAK